MRCNVYRAVLGLSLSYWEILFGLSRFSSIFLVLISLLLSVPLFAISVCWSILGLPSGNSSPFVILGESHPLYGWNYPPSTLPNVSKHHIHICCFVVVIFTWILMAVSNLRCPSQTPDNPFALKPVISAVSLVSSLQVALLWSFKGVLGDTTATSGGT